VPKMSSVKVSDNMVLMACGKGGSGKTTALATFPKPIYLFDIDQRRKGMLGSDIITDADLEQIEFDEYDTKTGFKKINQKFLDFANRYDKRQLEFKTIIVESADQLFEMLLLDSFKLKAGGKLASELAEHEKRGMIVLGDVNIPTPDEYKYIYACFRHIFYNYFKYFHKCNVILSAGTTPVWGKDPKDANNKYAQDVIVGRRIFAPQGLADLLPRMFDEVWEFNKKETGASMQPLMYEVSFRSDLAKTCIKQLPNGWLDITNKNFYNEIKKFLPKNVEVEEKVSALSA
jgi:AAA domain